MYWCVVGEDALLAGAGVCSNHSRLWALREACARVLSDAVAGLPEGVCGGGGEAACGRGGQLHWRLHLSLPCCSLPKDCER